ncbi:MAG: hypothetical protein ACRD1X_05305, partial [Vicinamibacteria bacterium]
MRVTSAGEPKAITLSSAGVVRRCINDSNLGRLVSVIHNGMEYTLWLPGFQEQFRFDSRGRIEVARKSHLSGDWALTHPIQLKVLQDADPGQTAVVPYTMFEDPGGIFFQELSSLGELESRLYRRSNWFSASRPLDLWKYLINGSLYDPRSSRRIGKRFKCQQCALAWWNYFRFLGNETGKRVYGLLQDEVAYTVLLDLSAEGEWGHGFWSDEMETHARFHLDGLRLLISQYEKTKAPVWLEAAERGMRFVFERLVDRFGDGSVWFLHDTLEVNIKHRFRSTVFGKNPGNSLCINTHVQALTVLHRLWHLAPNDARYEDGFRRGVTALRKVLDYQPGEIVYRTFGRLFRRYYRNAAPTRVRRKRIENSLKRRGIVMLYGGLKRLFPRLVMPGGFIDRDLSLAVASDHYHNTNLKDLLILYRHEQVPWLRGYIKNAFKFSLDLVRIWGLDKAVLRSPYYFEFMDVLHLYDRLIEPLPPHEVSRMEETLLRGTGAYSLDYYASELIRG